MVVSEKKAKASSSPAATKTDTGSAPVQVASMTARINELTAHLKVNKKDHMARRGLLQLVGKRKKLLKYIAERDGDEYLALIKELGIRR
jgi:small subunit ribosomal protein S15